MKPEEIQFAIGAKPTELNTRGQRRGRKKKPITKKQQLEKIKKDVKKQAQILMDLLGTEVYMRNALDIGENVWQIMPKGDEIPTKNGIYFIADSNSRQVINGKQVMVGHWIALKNGKWFDSENEKQNYYYQKKNTNGLCQSFASLWYSNKLPQCNNCNKNNKNIKDNDDANKCFIENTFNVLQKQKELWDDLVDIINGRDIQQYICDNIEKPRLTIKLIEDAFAFCLDPQNRDNVYKYGFSS